MTGTKKSFELLCRKLKALQLLDVCGGRLTGSRLKRPYLPHNTGRRYFAVCCRKLKALQSLEVCGGGLTDSGVAFLQDLSQLRSLSLAQVRGLESRKRKAVPMLYQNFRNGGVAYLQNLSQLRSLSLAQVTSHRHEVLQLKAPCRESAAQLPNLSQLRPLRLAQATDSHVLANLPVEKRSPNQPSGLT